MTSSTDPHAPADERAADERQGEPCGCCLDWGRFPGSGSPPCPTCGHTVEDCEREGADV